MSTFDLERNPFVQLGVTPRARREEINAAHSECLLDAETTEDERVIELCRKALFTPRERLAAELSYLLETRPADARAILAKSDLASLRLAAAAAPGLARINLLTQACTKAIDATTCAALANELVDAYSELDIGEAHLLLQEQRALAGFPEVARSDFESALGELGTAHANAVIAALARYPSLPDDMVSVIENSLFVDETPSHRFLSKLLESYERRVGHEMEARERQAVRALETFASSEGKPAPFTEFEAQLRAWDRFAQPLQLADELRGMDEVRSKGLFEEVRSHALDLANNRQRHGDALKISRLASEVFSELPTATEQLAEDIETLETIESEKSVDNIVGPLRAAAKSAKQSLVLTSTIVGRHGFNLDAPHPVGEVVRAYRDVLALKPETLVVELAAHEVRQISLALNNEREDYQGAERVIGLLLANAGQLPKELIARLEQDRQTLSRSANFELFHGAMREGRLNDAKNHCDLLIDLADEPDARDQLIGLRDELEKRISQKRVKSFVGWGIAAGIAALVIAGASEDKSSGPAMSDSSFADNGSYPAGDALDGVGSGGDPIPTEDAATEAPPPFGAAYRTFSLPEIRYCLKQSERIEGARAATYSYGQEGRFNTLVEDWNGRCAQFRYRPTDLATINAEVALERVSLRQEGRELVAADNEAPAYASSPSVDIDQSTIVPEPPPAPSDDQDNYIDEQGNLVQPDAPADPTD